MDKHIRLEGDRITLQTLLPEDISQEYYTWMNDKEVTQYTESRLQQNTMESICDYVTKMRDSKNDVLFRIIEKESNKHIGNIRLGQMSDFHKSAEIGILIGDKSKWGKGYGSEAIRLAVSYGFNTLGLHKITAGCYSNNPGSQKAFEKAGFRSEGRRISQYKYNDSYVDALLFGIVHKSRHSR